MQLNGILFPKTVSTYDSTTSYGRLVYIPHDRSRWDSPPFLTSDVLYRTLKTEGAENAADGHEGPFVPCLYLGAKKPSTKVLIFFHGNAEDVVSSMNLLRMVRRALPFHVFSMEYKGYGIYEGEASAESILEDAELLLEYLMKVHKKKPGDLVIMGRSIGSGPASYVAGKYGIHSLILLSPFTSIRAMAKKYVGSTLQYLIAERFDNATQLKNSKCPIFLIHGKKDDIVPYTHSVEMWKQITAPGLLNLPPNMTHGSFAFFDDFVKPLTYFYEVIGIDTEATAEDSGLLRLPKKFFMPPKRVKK
eukprot:TRINITY_DN7589_c0_g2_i1.p1 TRINITY_DN7589_c0_g2~~TRINITY_DN7589_c0_g2_i1.p1  ORF type:complete len:304 (+),score=81.78 TRINITY_DN7589_c0_g2_i1:59-970(+)